MSWETALQSAVAFLLDLEEKEGAADLTNVSSTENPRGKQPLKLYPHPVQHLNSGP